MQWSDVARFLGAISAFGKIEPVRREKGTVAFRPCAAPYRAGAANMSYCAMAEVIELKQGDEPRRHTRYALVVVSSKPPKEGAAIAIREDGQTFFADDNEHDVRVILGRAKIWADENTIQRVYVQREGQ